MARRTRHHDKLIDDPVEAQAARQRILDEPTNVWIRFKVYIYRNLFPAPTESSWLDTSIMVLIAANLVAVVLETEADLSTPYIGWFVGFE